MAKIKDSMNIQKEERVEDSFENSEGEGEIVEDSFDKIQEKICNEEGEVSSRILIENNQQTSQVTLKYCKKKKVTCFCGARLGKRCCENSTSQ